MGRTSDNSGIIFNIKRFSVHDGPGIRTSIFLKGCPLKCIWCHNPEGIDSDITLWYNSNLCIACGQCVQVCPKGALTKVKQGGKFVEKNRDTCTLSGNCISICPTGALEFSGKEISVKELVEEIRKDLVYYHTSGGGVTVTGGEPAFQPDFCLDILRTCKCENIHTAIETCLYFDRKLLIDLMDVTNLFIVDLKIFDPVQHERYTGKSNHLIKENIRYLADSCQDIIIRIPLIPGITDSKSNVEEIENFVNDLKITRPIDYLKYNWLTNIKYKRLNIPFSINKS